MWFVARIREIKANIRLKISLVGKIKRMEKTKQRWLTSESDRQLWWTGHVTFLIRIKVYPTFQKYHIYTTRLNNSRLKWRRQFGFTDKFLCIMCFLLLYYDKEVSPRGFFCFFGLLFVFWIYEFVWECGEEKNVVASSLSWFFHLSLSLSSV